MGMQVIHVLACIHCGRLGFLPLCVRCVLLGHLLDPCEKCLAVCWAEALHFCETRIVALSMVKKSLRSHGSAYRACAAPLN